jgi:hypothetical protein
MRKVGHLVGRHDVDNPRAAGLECLVDLGVQLAGLRDPNPRAGAAPVSGPPETGHASGQPARSFLPNSDIPTDKSHARAADHHKYLTRAVPA